MGKPWQTFPSFRQVLASSSCSSSPTPGPAGPISDGNSCRSRILSAHSRLTSNQLRLMNATGSTAMTKLTSFCLHIWLSSLHCFFPLISINYLRVALIALVQLLMPRLKMKHVLPGTDVALVNLCSLLACLLSGHHLNFKLWFLSSDVWGQRHIRPKSPAACFYWDSKRKDCVDYMYILFNYRWWPFCI